MPIYDSIVRYHPKHLKYPFPFLNHESYSPRTSLNPPAPHSLLTISTPPPQPLHPDKGHNFSYLLPLQCNHGSLDQF